MQASDDPVEVAVGGQSSSAITQAQLDRLREEHQAEAQRQAEMQQAIMEGMRERELEMQSAEERVRQRRAQRDNQRGSVQNTICLAIALGAMIYLSIQAYNVSQQTPQPRHSGGGRP